MSRRATSQAIALSAIETRRRLHYRSGALERAELSRRAVRHAVEAGAATPSDALVLWWQDPQRLSI